MARLVPRLLQTQANAFSGALSSPARGQRGLVPRWSERVRMRQLMHPCGPPPGARWDMQGYLEANSVNDAGHMLLAILMLFLPVWLPPGRRAPLTTVRSWRGLSKAVPGFARRPLPWSACCGKMLDLALRQRVAMAWCCLIMIDAGLRPSEACELRVGAMALCWLIMIDTCLRRGKAKFWQPTLSTSRRSSALLSRLGGRLSPDEVMRIARSRTTSSVARYAKRALVQGVVRRMSIRAEAAIVGVLRKNFARG